MSEFVAILKYAISLERQAIQFYEKLSDSTQRAEIKEVLREIINQEKAHKKKLEHLCNKHETPSKKRVLIDLKLSDYVIAVDESKSDLSYEDSLVIGMKREQVSVNLYAQLSNDVEELEAKQLFQFLADEERQHKHYFETKFDNLQQ